MTTFAFGSIASRATLRGSLHTLVGHVVFEWRARRAERALGEMDDALLYDIGVGRAAIADAVRHGRPNRR